MDLQNSGFDKPLLNLQSEEAKIRKALEKENYSNTKSLLASSKVLESLLDGESAYTAIVDSFKNFSKNTLENHEKYKWTGHLLEGIHSLK